MKKIIFILLLAFVGTLAVLHALTPGHMIFFHDTFRRLGYLPIAIGAILYGLKGGLGLAGLSSLAFVPHLFLFWARGPQAYYSELSEIVFYLVAGGVIGLISSRENNLREKYRQVAEKLAGSYQRLHEQTAQLVQAEKQLGQSQKLSMLGHVSASLAHEIKNPLASIKGAAEILADEVGRDHPKYEFVEIMRSEISRLNHSVEDVLSYCRGQHVSETTKQERMGTLINRVVSLLETRLKEKSISISFHPDPGCKDVLTDEAAMIQVLMNILINAIDAVQKKGRIVIDLYPCEQGACIRISDDGPGIDENRARSVFGSFVTFKKWGTGLGLPISKRIIERLGGSISIEKSSLGGAAVLMVLPEKKTGDNEIINHV